MLDQGLLDAVKVIANVWLARLSLCWVRVNMNSALNWWIFWPKIAGTTDKIRLSQQFDANLSPMSFKIRSQDKDTGIILVVFQGSRVYLIDFSDFTIWW